jgi:NAD-dependent DNA ligase
MTDIIEDIFAFMYATGEKTKTQAADMDSICLICGSEMEYDDESEEMRCSDCDT